MTVPYRPMLLVLSVALWGACAYATEQNAMAGGRDVTVALFSARDVRSVTMTPIGQGAWSATCAACVHMPLTVPVTLSHGEMFFGGTMRAQDAAAPGTAVTTTGLWHLRASARGMDVVLTLPSERYTTAAVSGEAAADEPVESLRALAVVARTYALNGPHYSAGAGHLPADLCDSTQCQALRFGGQGSRAIADAVESTAGETLWFRGRRAEVFFSGHCGGEVADVTETWGPDVNTGRRAALPYLRHHADPFCVRASSAAWHTIIAAEELQRIAQGEGWHIPSRLTRATVMQRSASGRAVLLSLQGEDGDAMPLSASSLRFAVGRALGWNRIRSDLYTVTVRNGALVLDGRGHGHGVGLCQTGAAVMANEQRDMRSILEFYFPGTRVGVTAADNGWRTVQGGPVTLRSTQPLPTTTQQMVTAAWQFALKTFPVMNAPVPMVVFTPSTELFRQMTAQPGWDLASTRGRTVTLQPWGVLQRAAGGAPEALRHELLHVLVEQDSTERAPLWLREGLVEALTQHTGGSAASLPASVLEAQLAHPSSMATANAAHTASGARVTKLIARYGLVAVRGWLKSGVPASVASER